MPTRILMVTSSGLPEERVEDFRGAHPDLKIETASDDAASVAEAVEGIDALVGCPRHVWSDELLEQAGPSLRWVHVTGAGCEEFLTPGLVESDVVLTNGRIIQGPEVADHAVALLLTLTRNIDLTLRQATSPATPRPVELRGKTAAVFGLGGIGMLIAERLAAFGMHLIGVNPDLVPMMTCIDRIVPPERRLEVLPEADAVVCAVPRTPASVGMFGDSEFAAMRGSAFFVNVSRGALVDTSALVEALRAGKIAGAGLDVTNPEPLPGDHPLRRMERVVVTAHLAGLSDHNRARSATLVEDNVARFAAGLPLFNVVDKRLGY